jgi:hypothetical protein
MEQFIKLIAAVKEAKNQLGNPSKVWYRGQANTKDSLIPSLLRYSNGIEKEQILYERYKQSTSKTSQSLKSWDVLYNMQHYGIPTRLLDWTDVLGTALFFLSRKSISNESTLWLLNPAKLNEKNGWQSRLPFLPSDEEYLKGFDYYNKYLKGEDMPHYPIAVNVNYVNDRILAQKGCFTVHGKEEDSLEKLASDCVQRITIQQAWNVDIREFLEYADINEFSIFPDNGGLAPFLKSIVGLEEKVVVPVEDEKRPLGNLIINSATYGTDMKYNDVTKILNERISKNGELDVIAKNELFGDPHEGFLKKLIVKHTSNGVNVTSEVSEHGRLRIP